MKVFLRNFAMIALLVLPSYGQSGSTPSNPAGLRGSSDAAIHNTAPLEMSPAEDSSAESEPAAGQDAGMAFPLFRTIGGLGLVLCIIAAAYFAAKKFAPRYFAKGISDRNLKIIETLSMGDKRSVSMIEVGNSRFLIGNTPNQINLLAVLPEPFSMVSEPDKFTAASKDVVGSDSAQPFRNMFEMEKRRPAQYAANPIPDDIRAKMRQLRASLER